MVSYLLDRRPLLPSVVLIPTRNSIIARVKRHPKEDALRTTMVGRRTLLEGRAYTTIL